ncbi:glucose-1-phosphate cytidylyltransferase [Loktanella sp. DJP18]|uniref:glucose-1-phosphate cytidylyltransferase n=1 Tax=Loktanella sp. DJP18 TaxID=3409788 RepID=UPI003BB69983
MQVVLLCGGVGSRFPEETEVRPKPMIEIGHKPILWHIMQIYSHFGHDRFVLCTGYKGDVIKKYFLNYRHFSQDIEVDLAKGQVRTIGETVTAPPWSVRIQDTGVHTMTGARLKRAMRYVDDDIFLATYGDGVANVDILRLVEKHKESGKLATVTAVRPSSRFGELGLEGDLVTSFQEKPQTGQGWINGGFFVFSKSIFESLPDDPSITLEEGILQDLSRSRQLGVYVHDGFWQCMDTLREKALLESYWKAGNAPWKLW